MKTTIKLIASLSLLSLANCVSHQSTDPIGDGFTNAGNAIGNVVNKVLPEPAVKPVPNIPKSTAPAVPQTTYRPGH